MALITSTIWGDIAALLITVGFLIILYFKYAFTYWKRKNVPYIEPKFPLGNLKSYVLRSYVPGPDSAEYYNELKSRGHKFGGIFTLFRPVLVLTDPDYIKDILSKDFQHFVDRGAYHVDEDALTNNLFSIGDDKWKGLRSKLSPTFTSGKMKMMFNTVLECSNYMVDFMNEKARSQQDIDILEVLASFTVDVIGACAFGLNCNSFKDKDAEFRTVGQSLFKDHGIIHAIKRFLVAAVPDMSKALKIKPTVPKISNFFFDVVKNTLKYRKENNISRPDFLQLVINIHKEDPTFTLEDLVAQVFVFFLAGFDTSSAAMNFTLYELSRNPEIQNKVREEIKAVLKKHNNNITYESLHELKYLGQVLEETLRLYPSVVTLTRKCTKDYQLRDTDVIIDKGTIVYISLYGLHRDPEYYLDPEKYDPDRFSPENQGSRHQFVYLPFGDGPRNCIGLRFGVMQSKIGLIKMLTNYKFSISPNAELPLSMVGDVNLLRSQEKLLLRAEKIP
ncbi:unnamed protein product [Brassicogethes aeneus]|uniref:Cytochrome P450 n=1 Tax=Brassicogethes aeneus TaxID=1431903 RepID=A0A9P0AZ90_BRAAE|nr:unnamed protein product [Brassicogethes aeneus]